jgi:hypothetical protein
VLFVALFPDTLFEVISAIRAKFNTVSQDSEFVEQKLYGSAIRFDEKVDFVFHLPPPITSMDTSDEEEEDS